MPFTKEQVYQAENLRFATQAEKREPTLYFRTGHGSGRLRQDHPTAGPMAQEVRMHTTHAFFEKKEQQIAFHKAVASQGTDLTRDQYRELRSAHGGQHTPQENFHHHEASFQGHGGGSKVITQPHDASQAKLHISGGTVVSPSTLSNLRSQTSSIAKKLGVGS